jgi:hypothetical protein
VYDWVVFDEDVFLPDDQNQGQSEVDGKWWNPFVKVKAEQHKFLPVTEMKSTSPEGLGIHGDGDGKKGVPLGSLDAVRLLDSQGVDTLSHHIFRRADESLDEDRETLGHRANESLDGDHETLGHRANESLDGDHETLDTSSSQEIDFLESVPRAPNNFLEYGSVIYIFDDVSNLCEEST